MGWHFDLKHSNIVTYLTSSKQKEPPRLTVSQLAEFLRSLRGIHEGNRSPLISSRPGWIRQIGRIAHDAENFVERCNVRRGSFISPEVIGQALGALRAEFSCFAFYALAVSNREQAESTRSFAIDAAYSSGEHGLFLIPESSGDGETIEMLDPSPIARKITSRSDYWPGILFWIQSGSSAFVPLSEANELYRRIMWAVTEKSPFIVGRVLEKWEERQSAAPVKRIFHLSDLHFGRKEALRNQAYLSSHLKTKLERSDRIVVTGDLYNNPKDSDATAFRNFRLDLLATTGKDAIVVPGNHDQKVNGNSIFGFGRRLDQLAKLEWSSVVIDDDLECVFFCFDSSQDSTPFARGKITINQMNDVGSAFEAHLAANPKLKDYLSMALVHHHPYSFETKPVTLLQKGLSLLKLSDEDFLTMEDADQFLSWCAGRRIPLILHGHKHVARHVRDQIDWSHGINSGSREIVSVGCGTSLGIKGYPLSYNVVEWNPKIAKWTTSFFSDRGDGSGFEEVYVALQSMPHT